MLLAIERLPPRGGDRGAQARTVVLGVLAGGAAAVKLTGGAAIVVPCLWYGIQMLRNDRRRRPARCSVVLYLAVVLGVAFPFYLRPWLATGNPFHPFFAGWFTRDAAPLDVSGHHHAIGGLQYGVKSLAAFVDAPLLLAFRAENYDGEFGWQLLVLLALVLVAVVAGRGRRRWIVWWPAAVALWFYLFWFATAQQARFLVPGMPALAMAAGLGLRSLRRGWRPLLLAMLAAAALASVPWRRADYYRASWQAATGRLSRTDYVHNLTDQTYLPLIQAIHALTPPDARLMLLYEHRGFYLLRHHVIGTPLFQEGPFTPPEQFTDSQAVHGVLKRMGISYLAAGKAVMGPDHAAGSLERQQPLWSALEQCVREGRLKPIWESEEYHLFERQ
jgi:hypothetical protein